MNKLSTAKRAQIINLLVEGNSLRATSRLTGTSINTVTKLLVDVGKMCQAYHDFRVFDIPAKRIECDEIWSFVYAKKKNVEPNHPEMAGDVWTWIAIDPETKLIISWYVGLRDGESATEFMKDVKSRLKHRVQITSDGLRSYLDAVEDTFGDDVDFAQLDKIYDAIGKRPDGKLDKRIRYIKADKKPITGNPDPKYITTSYIERQNLTMRMHMRRFTRKTNAFSKKIENHCYAIALHFFFYNFIKVHQTLKVTPAMKAGLAAYPVTFEELTDLS